MTKQGGKWTTNLGEARNAKGKAVEKYGATICLPNGFVELRYDLCVVETIWKGKLLNGNK